MRRSTFALVAAASLGSATPLSAAQPKPTYGEVHFANSCAARSQAALQVAIAKLHSFEATTSDFTAIATRDPSCAIAWWGAAMSTRGNPIGDSLDDTTLRLGHGLIERAKAVPTATAREKALIAAMDIYYRPYADQITRARVYSDRMDAVHAAYPEDPDIAAFDGLAIIEGVDLDDRTLARQKRAGTVLEQVMKTHPKNPGAPHYLIHAFDYTALAKAAVPAAEIYPRLATASSHAQHMPSHIWSMLGEWDKSIAANRAASYVADPSSNRDPVKGDIVFAHAFDFITYARLQKGEDRHVGQDLAAVKRRPTVILARYALERADWSDAARLPMPENDVFDALLAHFTRGYGAARAGNVTEAQSEAAALKAMRPTIKAQLGAYWAAYVDIYSDAVSAWALRDEGKSEQALALMQRAADRDARHEKHIYLENKLVPMRESLGDMELALGHPGLALAAYRASLTLAPNRYRSFEGAAQAALASGDRAGARAWFEKLAALAKDGDQMRPGDKAAKAFLGGNG